MEKTIYMGSDHAGFRLKEVIKDHLENLGHTVIDMGPDSQASCDYPDYAHKVCEAVLAGDLSSMGVLICGTGIGMSLAANKHKGIRAALCTTEFHARMARLHNDANVLCLGERVTGTGIALDLAELFAATSFEGGRHQRRVDLIEP